MATNVPVPPLGDSISQVTILRWLKNEGDFVRVDEPIVEVETDKANTELNAPKAGGLHQMRKAGETLKVGEVFASVDESVAAPAGTTASAPAPAVAVAATAPAAPQPAVATSTSSAGGSPPTPTPTRGTPAFGADLSDLNPSVRPLIIEHKLNPKDIPGSGPHGRLLKEDVLRYIEQNNGKSQPKAESVAPVAAAPTTTSPLPPGVVPAAKSEVRPPAAKAADRQFDANGIAREQMTKIRIATAANLKKAQETAAILTTFNEVDMSAIMELRTRLKERFEKIHGIGLGFMSFFSRAVILGLREFPRVNAFIEGDTIVFHNYVNLGVAVSTDRGLSVPVLKHAEQMSFAKIESEIKRVATAVRDGKLGLQDLSGGTFTITNGGVFGSLLSTPILNPPQSGILGMHTIQKRPVAINDKVEIRPMMYVALSYDHRIVDGKDSVSFLVRVKEYLEDPARLMLEI